MKISSIQFIQSVADIRQLPERKLPEIAFVGRSNVGKSSLINCLLNNKTVAKISSTPGKTRALNFFMINENFYMVDLPGYGFAKISKDAREQWRLLIEAYFTHSQMLKGAVVLTDSRHDLTRLDLEMIEWLAHRGIPQIIVGTKADKLSGNKLVQQLKLNQNQLNALLPEQKIVPFSAIERTGKEELWSHIENLIKGKA